MQSNQNNVTLGGFTDRVTDAMFPNHGEMELPGSGGSSPWAGQVPVIARRPSHMRPPLYGTTMMGSNQLGAGIHRNGMFNDDQLLSSAFRSMSLSFTDAEGYPPVHSQYTYPQMPQVGTPGVLWSRSNYSTMASASCSLRAPSVNQLRHHSDDNYWTVTVNPNGNSKRSSELLNNCSDCSCGNCEYCHIKQTEKLDQYGIRCSLDGAGESIFLLAKDPKGSCFLQSIIDIGAPEYVMKVFSEIIRHIGELIIDPFGNLLVQKLLEVCTNHQKMHIIDEMTKRPGQLMEVSCNNHGTCVVQKLIETINSEEEASMIVSALSPGAVTLMMDVNGYHVAHHCLKNLSPEHKQDEKVYCTCEQGPEGKMLYNITSRALDLSQHQYGNYVIHYIMCLKVMWATDIVFDKLEGYYGYLSMQKYSSHVVEKCLKEAHEPKRLEIIHELINDPRLINILLHKYGNYVIQTALKECENAAARAALVRAIRTHVAALRNNKYGKRILSKIHRTNREY